MVSGAGSVAVSARPILPNTVLTSGTVRISLSVCCSNSCALPIEMPGKVVGMYIRSPSFEVRHEFGAEPVGRPETDHNQRKRHQHHLARDAASSSPISGR